VVPYQHRGLQRNLDLLLECTRKNAAGKDLGIDMAAIDGNAWADSVYEWVRRHASSKVIMVRGDSRDAAPRLSRVKGERNKKSR
jgi:phage terminase large subunit GpA-like protein